MEGIALGVAAVIGEQRDRAGAVAAHLGQGTVGIAIVHEPFGAVLTAFGDLLGRQIGHVLGMCETDHAISANAEMAIVKVPYLVGSRLEPAFGIGIYDEIVAGGMRFGDLLRNTHAPHPTRRHAQHRIPTGITYRPAPHARNAYSGAMGRFLHIAASTLERV